MTRTFAISAITLALSFAGAAAHAGCADPRLSGESLTPQAAPLNLHQKADASRSQKQAAATAIVGTWHVAYTSNGSPFAQAFIQWHDDGTEWENISQPTLGGNICMGSWKSLDRTHVYRNHYGWLFTKGVVSGYFNETETVELSPDWNSYRGINNTSIFDMSGNLLAQVPGTAEATRIEP